MTKFLSNSRNPYAEKTRDEKKENVKAKLLQSLKQGLFICSEIILLIQRGEK